MCDCPSGVLLEGILLLSALLDTPFPLIVQEGHVKVPEVFS